jgi:hypothetical protein
MKRGIDLALYFAFAIGAVLGFVAGYLVAR